MWPLLFWASGIVLPTPDLEAAAQEIQVVAQVDPSQPIYAGQRFTYQIVVHGHRGAVGVDMLPMAAYGPQRVGQNVITNQVNQQVTQQAVVSYSLVVHSPGPVTLPSVTVTVEGKAYPTNPVQVDIRKPGTTDKVALEVDLEDRTCYVGQPVLMTVRLYVAADADVGEVEFNVPVFSDNRFLFEDPETIDPQAKLHRITLSVAAYVTQSDVSRDGRAWSLVRFSKVLIPQQAGTLDLGEVSVSVSLAVGLQRSRGPLADFGLFGARKQYAPFSVAGPPVEMTVRPLPEQDRPAGFYGLVGRYTISASATPTEVSVGDPITLTLRIGGNPFLRPVRWPSLSQIPEMEDHFRIPGEQASPVTEDGFKVFTQTLRAAHDRVTQIPPIPLVYFDADQGRYVTARTDPIPLKVSPTKVLTNADIGGRASDRPVNKEVEAIKQGMAANYEDPGALTHQAFSPALALVRLPCVALWLLPLGLLIGSASYRAITHTTPERQAQQRRRRAASRALGQLEAVLSRGPHERHQVVAAALRRFLGDRFDRTAGSLTAADGRQIVAAATGDEGLARRVHDLLAECEAAHYSSARATLEDRQVQEAMEVLREVDRRARP